MLPGPRDRRARDAVRRGGDRALLRPRDLAAPRQAARRGARLIAMPGLFTPVVHDGTVLVDGGLVNPVPVSMCRALGAEVVIAIDLSWGKLGPYRAARRREVVPRTRRESRHGFERLRHGWLGRRATQADEEPQIPSIFEVFNTALDIVEMRVARSRLSGEPADVLITPLLPDFAHHGLPPRARGDRRGPRRGRAHGPAHRAGHPASPMEISAAGRRSRCSARRCCTRRGTCSSRRARTRSSNLSAIAVGSGWWRRRGASLPAGAGARIVAVARRLGGGAHPLLRVPRRRLSLGRALVHVPDHARRRADDRRRWSARPCSAKCCRCSQMARRAAGLRRASSRSPRARTTAAPPLFALANAVVIARLHAHRRHRARAPRARR